MNAVPNDWTSRLAKSIAAACMRLICGICGRLLRRVRHRLLSLARIAGVVLADCPKLKNAKGKSVADCVRSVWIRELLAENIAG
jgi:hypothetical protein